MFTVMFMICEDPVRVQEVLEATFSATLLEAPGDRDQRRCQKSLCLRGKGAATKRLNHKVEGVQARAHNLSPITVYRSSESSLYLDVKFGTCGARLCMIFRHRSGLRFTSCRRRSDSVNLKGSWTYDVLYTFVYR